MLQLYSCPDMILPEEDTKRNPQANYIRAAMELLIHFKHSPTQEENSNISTLM